MLVPRFLAMVSLAEYCAVVKRRRGTTNYRKFKIRQN